MESIFKKLSAINVNEHISKLSTGGKELSYLSWADAISLLQKEFNDDEICYTVYENENLDFLPIFGNPKMGYFVKTSITIKGITREMRLPILDNRNKTVLEPTAFDINSSVMRCTVKNAALFGLGLYIYQGQDINSIADHNEANELSIKLKSIIDNNKDNKELTDTFKSWCNINIFNNKKVTSTQVTKVIDSLNSKGIK